MRPALRLSSPLLAATLAVAGLSGLPTGASAAAPCAEAEHAAGEWPSYGGDLANSRTQTKSAAAGPAVAATLAKSAVFKAAGDINTTPIVSGGCVFLVSPDASGVTGAVLTARRADDLTEVWTAEVLVGRGGYGGTAVGAPAVVGDLVIAPFNRQGEPFVAAFNKSTGEEVWRHTIDNQPSSGINSSVVAWNGMVLAGFFGAAGPDCQEQADAPECEDYRAERGGYTLIDAASGERLARTFVIPDSDFAQGFAGAGIWGTAVVDPDTGFGYVGTSNPHHPKHEHPRSDSLIKIDLNRGSPTFGQILASYKGISDTIVPDGQKQPVCQKYPNVNYFGVFSITCLAVDLDFGASPNLIKTGGRTLLGGLQKAGVYHLVDTADMSSVSRTPVGAPCFACNAGSSSSSGGVSYVAAGPPGQLVAIDTALGVPKWAAPIGGGFTFNATSVGGGLVWMVDSGGFLDAWDTRTGTQVLKRALQLDTGASMVKATSSAGVAIARNTVYAALGSYVVAYPLPSGAPAAARP